MGRLLELNGFYKESGETLADTMARAAAEEKKKAFEKAKLLAQEEELGKPPISRWNIIKKLRKLGLEITIFGETDMQRYKRLREVETKNQRGRDVQDFAHNILTRDDVGIKEDFDGDADFEFDDEDFVKGADAVTEREKIIKRWIKKGVKVWEMMLGERTEEERKTAQGRVDSGQQRQSKKDIQPFLKSLKKADVQNAALDGIAKLIEYCDKGDFHHANELYLEMTVGDAILPSGAAGAGHGSGAVKTRGGYIMSSEAMRKYFQVIKRLLAVLEKREKQLKEQGRTEDQYA